MCVQSSLEMLESQVMLYGSKRVQGLVGGDRLLTC